MHSQLHSHLGLKLLRYSNYCSSNSYQGYDCFKFFSFIFYSIFLCFPDGWISKISLPWRQNLWSFICVCILSIFLAFCTRSIPISTLYSIHLIFDYSTPVLDFSIKISLMRFQEFYWKSLISLAASPTTLCISLVLLHCSALMMKLLFSF